MGEVSNARMIVKTNWKDTMWMEALGIYLRILPKERHESKLEYSVFKPGMSRIRRNADNTEQ